VKPGLRAFTCRAEPLFYEARTPSPGEVRSLSQQITGVKTSSAPREKVDVGINIWRARWTTNLSSVALTI
jgi:hypothetical protein